MAPVARELSGEWSVLEPLQTADSLEGQVQELRAVLADNASLPTTLVGSSWGAMLGLVFCAQHPEFVQTDLKQLEYASTIVFFRRLGLDWPTAIEKACAFKATQAVRSTEPLARRVIV
jgi:pimeloyl-ACP methyl ester carboxylesterase